MFEVSHASRKAVRAPTGRQVYSARASGALFAGAGIACLLLLGLMPGVFDGEPVAVLIGLSLVGGGLFGLLTGYAGLLTRIEVRPAGLLIEVPSWRAVPLPPVRRIEVGWDQVNAVRRRIESYRLGFLPIRLPLEVLAVETASGRALFASYYLWQLEPILIDIANRADCPWSEDGTVEAGLFATLLRGPPAWPSPASAGSTRRLSRRRYLAQSQPTGS
jgi:hypothetical protein